MRPGDGRPSAWQVLADCPHCRTESAVIELFDPANPACRFAVPAERRCRLCGWAEACAPVAVDPAHPDGCPRCGVVPADGATACAGCGFAPTIREIARPEDLRDPARARAALTRWAEEEGERDVDVFCSGSFGADVNTVVALLGRGEPVPTLFDVIAFLFPSASGAGPSAGVDPNAVAPGELVSPDDPTVHHADRVDPRLPARVLVSVMVADGALRTGERAFVDAFLARAGARPLDPADLRVWRPSELGPPPPAKLRDELLEACVHLMHVDRERDGSEWRVIRMFSRAWGVPDAVLDGWDRRYERRYGRSLGALGRLLTRLTLG